MSDDFTDDKLSGNEEPDFEGHKLSSPEKITKVSVNEEPDFEGHKLSSPEKITKVSANEEPDFEVTS